MYSTRLLSELPTLPLISPVTSLSAEIGHCMLEIVMRVFDSVVLRSA